MALFQLPFTNIPQRFSVDLGGVTYVMVNRWNPIAELWYIDVYDQDDNPLLMNLPLVTGTDLFEQFAFMKPPGKMIVYTEGDEGESPTLETLGFSSNVWLVIE